MMQAQYKRSDGTFIVLLNGSPYHAVPGDPLFAAASDLCSDAPYEPLPAVPDPGEVLAQWRATASCSRSQGILALGEARWGMVLQYQTTATWSERVVIDDTSDWLRNSQDVAFLAYLMDLADVDVDALFGGLAA